MKELRERLRIAQCVLRELSRQPLASRSELTRRTIQRGGTYHSFNGIFAFLVTEGYIEKSGCEWQAPYRITDRGLKLLEAL